MEDEVARLDARLAHLVARRASQRLSVVMGASRNLLDAFSTDATPAPEAGARRPSRAAGRVRAAAAAWQATHGAPTAAPGGGTTLAAGTARPPRAPRGVEGMGGAVAPPTPVAPPQVSAPVPCFTHAPAANRIRVHVRVRPPTVRGAPRWDAVNCVHVTSAHTLAIAPPEDQGADGGAGGEGAGSACGARAFTFTRVLDDSTSQQAYYEATAAPLVADLLRGGGGETVVLAYGVTGSGKTYTMEGTPDDPGLVTRTLTDIYTAIARREGGGGGADPGSSTGETGEGAGGMGRRADPECDGRRPAPSPVPLVATLSACEIWNEEAYDLLGAETAHPPPRGRRRPLPLRSDASGRVVLDGQARLVASDLASALTLARRASAGRARASTALNFASSRSHSVLCVELHERGADGCPVPGRPPLGRICFCDLAGSERAARTGNVGARLKESSAINSSLMVLGQCLEKTLRIQMHPDERPLPVIPFRSSKITHLFRDALHGFGTIVLAVCVSPVAADHAETIRVLDYAAKAAQIGTVPGFAPRRAQLYPGPARRRAAPPPIPPAPVAPAAALTDEVRPRGHPPALAGPRVEARVAGASDAGPEEAGSVAKGGAVGASPGATAAAGAPEEPRDAPGGGPGVIGRGLKRLSVLPDIDELSSACARDSCDRTWGGDATPSASPSHSSGASDVDTCGTPTTPQAWEEDDELTDLHKQLADAEERAAAIEAAVRAESKAEMEELLKEMERSYRRRLDATRAAVSDPEGTLRDALARVDELEDAARVRGGDSSSPRAEELLAAVTRAEVAEAQIAEQRRRGDEALEAAAAEVAQLRAEVAEQRRRGDEALEAAAAEAAQLRAEVAEQRRRGDEALEAAAAEAAQLRAEVAEQGRRGDEALEAAAAEAAQLRAEVAEQRRRGDEALEAAAAEAAQLRAEVAEQGRRGDEALEAAAAEAAQLRAEVAEQRRRGDEALEAAAAQGADAEEQVRLSRAGAAALEHERAEARVGAAMAERARDEAQAATRAAAEQHCELERRLTEDCERLRSEARTHAEEAERLKSDLADAQERHASALAEHRARHEGEISALRDDLERARAETAQARRESSSASALLSARVTQLEANHAMEREVLEVQLDRARRESSELEDRTCALYQAAEACGVPSGRLRAWIASEVQVQREGARTPHAVALERARAAVLSGATPTAAEDPPRESSPAPSATPSGPRLGGMRAGKTASRLRFEAATAPSPATREVAAEEATPEPAAAAVPLAGRAAAIAAAIAASTPDLAAAANPDVTPSACGDGPDAPGDVAHDGPPKADPVDASPSSGGHARGSAEATTTGAATPCEAPATTPVPSASTRSAPSSEGTGERVGSKGSGAPRSGRPTKRKQAAVHSSRRTRSGHSRTREVPQHVDLSIDSDREHRQTEREGSKGVAATLVDIDALAASPAQTCGDVAAEATAPPPRREADAEEAGVRRPTTAPLATANPPRSDGGVDVVPTEPAVKPKRRRRVLTAMPGGEAALRNVLGDPGEGEVPTFTKRTRAAHRGTEGENAPPVLPRTRKTVRFAVAGAGF